MEMRENAVTACAAALDAHVARKAAAGVDLTFLRTISGSIGGAVRMNAGCYGACVADVFESARALTRQGESAPLSLRSILHIGATNASKGPVTAI